MPYFNEHVILILQIAFIAVINYRRPGSCYVMT